MKPHATHTKDKRLFAASLAVCGLFVWGHVFAQDPYQPSHLQPEPLDEVAQGSLSLTGNISPAPPGAAWRLRGESIWRNPGSSAGFLLPGEHWIEFKHITGYPTPALRKEVLQASSREFAVEYGSLIPPAATGWVRAEAVSANEADESSLGSNFRWRINGESDWRESGYSTSGLLPANRSIEFRSFPGFVTPLSREIGIQQNIRVSLRATYHRIPTVPWSFSPLSEAQVGDAPYRYVGKVTSSHGTFTGTAIAQYTVLTTLEAVYDPETKGFLPGVIWQAAAHSGHRVPPAMSPAGYILLENFRDDSLASAENSLVAIYFRAPVCNGGWSGYHVNLGANHVDSAKHNWLVGGRLSLSAGYPSGSEAGKLHATGLRPIPAVSETTFSLGDFPSVEGLRGAPLMLRKSNGIFFPAAVFVGGTDDRTFRVIDQSVHDVIVTAEDAALRGKGGTFRDGNRLGTVFESTDPGRGKVRTIISDSTDITWNIAGESTLPSGSTVEVPAVESQVSFSDGTIPARTVSVMEGLTIEILVSMGQAYPVWAQGVFTADDHDTGKTGAMDDFDGDGVVNLLEWAFGLKAKTADARPLSQTVSGLPVVETVSPTTLPRLRIHYIRRKSAALDNVRYEAQFTGDFIDWDKGTDETCDDLPGGLFECVTVEDPAPADGTSRFARISVTDMNAP